MAAGISESQGDDSLHTPRRTRNIAFSFGKTRYKRRHLIGNTFSRLKDWRRIATRYDRCDHTFFSAICLAVTLSFILINESCLYHSLQFYSFVLTYWHFNTSISRTGRGYRQPSARLPGTFSARPPIRT